ncbi:MAG: hypothetical protein AAGJ54_05780 [Planctomycetota bacterium]
MAEIEIMVRAAVAKQADEDARAVRDERGGGGRGGGGRGQP